MKTHRILTINPGSTSTKIGIFENEHSVLEITLRHTSDELRQYDSVIAQLPFRKQLVAAALADAGIGLDTLAAVIGRGGLLKPIHSGIYEVSPAMMVDLQSSPFGEHASNLGGLIAAEIAKEAGVKAYIADPVVVDEMEDVARVCGLPEMERRSIFHALNQKAMARKYAARVGRKYQDMNLIVAHLGGGISVGAHRRGRIVDVNNCLNGEGPFSPERAGTLPAAQLAEMCFSGEFTREEILKKITGKGGLVAHLGTNNAGEVIGRIKDGDGQARLVMDAMCYATAKYIGEMATVLCGEVDAVILTGGIAHNKYVCDHIEKMTSFIAPVVVMAGEDELEALALSALRVLRGEEEPKVY